MAPYAFPATISARDIQRGYKKVFDAVKRTKRAVVVMTNNRPQAAIISVDALEEYKRMKEDQELFAIIDEIQSRNRDKTVEEVERDIAKDVTEVRKKIYAEAFGRP